MRSVGGGGIVTDVKGLMTSAGIVEVVWIVKKLFTELLRVSATLSVDMVFEDL